MVEYSNISFELEAAGQEIFKIEQYHNTYFSEITKQLLLHKPQIVHFSGHGSKTSELIFKNLNGVEEAVPSEILSGIFQILGKDIRLVCLNGCYSQEQAEAIAKHVDCVIGMPRSVISEQGAIEFAKSFYSTLAFGRSVKDAFDLAVHQLRFLSITPEVIPQICKKDGVNPSKLFIVTPASSPPKSETTIVGICKQFDAINQQVDKLKMGMITPTNFLNFIYPIVKEFSSNHDNTEKFGKQKVIFLQRLTNRLSTTIQEIDKYKMREDLEKSKIETIRCMEIVDEINGMINDICTQN